MAILPRTRGPSLLPEIERYFLPAAETESELETGVNRKSPQYVIWVQRELNRLGYGFLEEDGIAGAHTKAAVVRFQRRVGLTADGIVGPATEAALVRISGSNPPQGTTISGTGGVTPPDTTSSSASPPMMSGATPASPGANAFGEAFDHHATGESKVNAYLLTYLATMVYADRGLMEVTPDFAPHQGDELVWHDIGERLQTEPAYFMKYFQQHLTPLLYAADEPVTETNRPPQFQFITSPTSVGLIAEAGLSFDPEVMVIDTANAVFVVFRGTDPVAQGFDMGEWISTDLWAFLTESGVNG